jgi:hypothetical protein
MSYKGCYESVLSPLYFPGRCHRRVLGPQVDGLRVEIKPCLALPARRGEFADPSAERVRPCLLIDPNTLPRPARRTT